MKLSKFPAGVALFLLGVALLTSSSFLLVFCQVQVSFTKTIPEPVNPRESRVVAYYPTQLSAVPIIVPTIIPDSFKQGNDSSIILSPGGKPPKVGEITHPPVNIIPSNNFTVSATIEIPTTSDNVG
jgi:hypothetical protein